MKNIYYFLIAFVLFNFLFLNSLICQESGITIYTTANSSIPSNNILHIAVEDSQNIWMHSDAGLTKFDGTNWFTYNTQNSSLPSNNILDIKTQTGNIVWVCTDNGLVRIMDGIWTIYDNSNSGLINNSVSDIGFDSKGNIWVFNTGVGLFKTDLINWDLYEIKCNGIKINNIQNLVIDKLDSLFIYSPWQTNSGYNFLGWFKVYDDTTAALLFPGDQIYAWHTGYRIGIDSKNAKWIGREGSIDYWYTLKYINGEAIWDFYDHAIGFIIGVVVDKYDLIWCYGEDFHLGDYEICRQYDSEIPWREYYGESNSGFPQQDILIQDIAVDSSNNKWMATSNGIVVFNDKPIFSNIWPNGGEVLNIGENYTLKYYSKYSHESKLELTTDNGSTWHLMQILPNTNSDQFGEFWEYNDSTSYDWTIPDTINSSTNCRIRVSDLIRGDVYLESDANFTITGATSVDNKTIPISFSLSNNFPNPFNPTTKISYSIPKRSSVSLKVFNLLGSEVVELVSGEKDAGTYDINFDASNLPSGIYFYRIQSGSFTDTKKMILLK